VVEKFRDKYGTKDVKKYYSKFDVAILAHNALNVAPCQFSIRFKSAKKTAR